MSEFDHLYLSPQEDIGDSVVGMCGAARFFIFPYKYQAICDIMIMSGGKGGSPVSEQKLKIGLLGMGTVGGGVAAILERHREALSEKAGAELVLERVLVRDPRRPRAVDLPAERFTTEAASILHDPSIDLVVELMGGIEPARSYILEALRRASMWLPPTGLMARHGTELLDRPSATRPGSTTRPASGAAFLDPSFKAPPGGQPALKR